MIRKLFILIIYFIPFVCQAQHDVLVLQRRGMHERAYTIGDQFVFKTVYGQWFNGIITDLHHDTVSVAGQAFSYKEIAVIRRTNTKINYGSVGKFMMLIGGGFAGISAVNGALRHDPASQWFTPSGYVIAGVLVAGGFLLAEFAPKYYKLGGRFTLTYLQLTK
ncbi:MAG TPA: hypothetical protein VGR89_14910 [Puia sp.]|nr:hypothetical protein [Puia sp.]